MAKPRNADIGKQLKDVAADLEPKSGANQPQLTTFSVTDIFGKDVGKIEGEGAAKAVATHEPRVLALKKAMPTLLTEMAVPFLKLLAQGDAACLALGDQYVKRRGTLFRILIADFPEKTVGFQIVGETQVYLTEGLPLFYLGLVLEHFQAKSRAAFMGVISDFMGSQYGGRLSEAVTLFRPAAEGENAIEIGEVALVPIVGTSETWKGLEALKGLYETGVETSEEKAFWAEYNKVRRQLEADDEEYVSPADFKAKKLGTTIVVARERDKRSFERDGKTVVVPGRDNTVGLVLEANGESYWPVKVMSPNVEYQRAAHAGWIGKKPGPLTDGTSVLLPVGFLDVERKFEFGKRVNRDLYTRLSSFFYAVRDGIRNEERSVARKSEFDAIKAKTTVEPREWFESGKIGTFTWRFGGEHPWKHQVKDGAGKLLESQEHTITILVGRSEDDTSDKYGRVSLIGVATAKAAEKFPDLVKLQDIWFTPEGPDFEKVPDPLRRMLSIIRRVVTRKKVETAPIAVVPPSAPPAQDAPVAKASAPAEVETPAPATVEAAASA